MHILLQTAVYFRKHWAWNEEHWLYWREMFFWHQKSHLYLSKEISNFFFIMFRYQHLNSGKSQNHVNSPPSTPSPKEILILCSFTHFSRRPVKCVIASTAARQRDKERQSWQKDTYWQWGMGKPAWGTCVRSVEGSRVQRPCEHPLVRGVLQAAPSPSSLQTGCLWLGLWLRRAVLQACGCINPAVWWPLTGDNLAAVPGEVCSPWGGAGRNGSRRWLERDPGNISFHGKTQ